MHGDPEKFFEGWSCAGIILNTVARAQDFAQKIVECFPECEMIQMHSQFIISDRAEIEREILKRAGKILPLNSEIN